MGWRNWRFKNGEAASSAKGAICSHGIVGLPGIAGAPAGSGAIQCAGERDGIGLRAPRMRRGNHLGQWSALAAEPASPAHRRWRSSGARDCRRATGAPRWPARPRLKMTVRQRASDCSPDRRAQRSADRGRVTSAAKWLMRLKHRIVDAVGVDAERPCLRRPSAVPSRSPDERRARWRARRCALPARAATLRACDSSPAAIRIRIMVAMR